MLRLQAILSFVVRLLYRQTIPASLQCIRLAFDLGLELVRDDPTSDIAQRSNLSC